MPRKKKPKKHTRRQRDQCPCGLDARFGDCCGSPEGLALAALKPEVDAEVVRAEERAPRTGRTAAWEVMERAKRFNKGVGVAIDLKKAYALMSRAAGMGSSDALCGVGYMFAAGDGVAKDLKKAAEHFRRASDQGSLEGHFAYSQCLWQGVHVPMDEDAALALLTHASDQGHEESTETLQRAEGILALRNRANKDTSGNLGNLFADSLADLQLSDEDGGSGASGGASAGDDGAGSSGC